MLNNENIPALFFYTHFVNHVSKCLTSILRQNVNLRKSKCPKYRNK